MKIGPVISAGFPNPGSRRPFRISRIGYQLGVGQQASGINEPEKTADLARQAGETRKTQEAARGKETVVQPGEQTSASRPLSGDGRRRNPFLGRRRKRHRPSEDPRGFTSPELSEDDKEQIVDEESQGFDVSV